VCAEPKPVSRTWPTSPDLHEKSFYKQPDLMPIASSSDESSSIMAYSSSFVAEAVRRSIERIEAQNPNDPKVAELKRKALLRLAALQENDKRPRARVLVVQPQTHGE
jgi:hypothetical protein